VTEVARQRACTWTDYRSWTDDMRWEIIGGEAFAMTPAPTPRHQRIVHELDRLLGNYFAGKSCQVYPAPTDVRLTNEDIVQPDLAVVCDPDKIKRTHIDGAPTLVVEVLSPSTAAFDRVRKLRLYAQCGVREVWIVTPYPWLAEVFVLDGDDYRLVNAYEKDGILESTVFPDLTIALADVFDYPIDPGERIEMVKEGRPPYPATGS
jgi:Uma2 family endonuclease